MPVQSVIVGVDLAPIRPIPNVITYTEDITSAKCRAELRKHFKTQEVDVYGVQCLCLRFFSPSIHCFFQYNSVFDV